MIYNAKQGLNMTGHFVSRTIMCNGSPCVFTMIPSTPCIHKTNSISSQGFGLGKVQAYVFVSVVDMSILLFNGFLLLGFVVATVPDVLVLGSPGPTQVVDRDTSMKKCRYNRAYSMLEASCSNLELHDIPTNLKTDIQVRLSINTVS